MLIMKFGGASVRTPESFLKIAKIIIERSKEDQKIVVVVSAMANMTDELFNLAKKIHPNPPKREQDMLVSVGERISISLLAMALLKMGRDAVSFTGSQSGIVTTEEHCDAQIIDVRPKRVREVLELGKIAIVAGFQGVSQKGEITTLGRGGSDTSAVALAVSLGASRVEFYKDVCGIYDSDPNMNRKAQVLTKLEYKEALLIAMSGAKVLHPRCILLAEKNGIELSVRSFQSPEKMGTVVGSKEIAIQHPMYYEVASCSLT